MGHTMGRSMGARMDARAGGDGEGSRSAGFPERSARLAQELGRRILVLDGAMGTMIQARGLSADDFGGAPYEGCNEHLNLTRPDVIADIHAAYLEAGADLVSTNTFCCAPYVLAEYGVADRCQAAIRLYRGARRRQRVPVVRYRWRAVRS